MGFSRKRTSPQNPKPRGKNRICWGKSQISWGEKGKGKTQLLFSFNPDQGRKQISRSRGTPCQARQGHGVQEGRVVLFSCCCRLRASAMAGLLMRQRERAHRAREACSHTLSLSADMEALGILMGLVQQKQTQQARGDIEEAGEAYRAVLQTYGDGNQVTSSAVRTKPHEPSLRARDVCSPRGDGRSLSAHACRCACAGRWPHTCCSRHRMSNTRECRPAAGLARGWRLPCRTQPVGHAGFCSAREVRL